MAHQALKHQAVASLVCDNNGTIIDCGEDGFFVLDKTGRRLTLIPEIVDGNIASCLDNMNSFFNEAVMPLSDYHPLPRTNVFFDIKLNPDDLCAYDFWGCVVP
ncbi:MAG: hypothetical protein ACRC2T_20175 [Thermoguttaceae bacterium]